MRAKLTIDRGNTAIKAAAWSIDGQLLDTLKGDESLPAGDLVRAMEQRLLEPGEHFEAICWCTVVASEHADDAASLEGLSPRVIELTAHTPMPITIAYRTPDTLGADRVAVVLGARYLAGHNRPLLVSDIGTAVTYEFVEGDRYVGGNISTFACVLSRHLPTPCRQCRPKAAMCPCGDRQRPKPCAAAPCVESPPSLPTTMPQPATRHWLCSPVAAPNCL